VLGRAPGAALRAYLVSSALMEQHLEGRLTVSDSGSTTVSIDDVRSGLVGDLLTEADVIIAVDVNTREEEAVRGRYEWELACETGHEDDLLVLRIELDADAGDLEWLVDAIENGETYQRGDGRENDEEEGG